MLTCNRPRRETVCTSPARTAGMRRRTTCSGRSRRRPSWRPTPRRRRPSTRCCPTSSRQTNSSIRLAQVRRPALQAMPLFTDMKSILLTAFGEASLARVGVPMLNLLEAELGGGGQEATRGQRLCQKGQYCRAAYKQVERGNDEHRPALISKASER